MKHLSKIDLENTYNLIKNDLVTPHVCFTPDTNHVHFCKYVPLGFVDFGLPSGTLWAKYNLGANSEIEYGDYYMWAYTTPITLKSDGTIDPPILASREYHKYYDEYGNATKYKNSYTELLPEDDAATLLLGEKYKVPSREDFIELCENSKVFLDDNYKNSGIRGLVLKSNINDNEIFLPSGGLVITKEIDGDVYYTSISSTELVGEYWESNCTNYGNAYYAILVGHTTTFNNHSPENGIMLIRPVLK